MVGSYCRVIAAQGRKALDCHTLGGKQMIDRPRIRSLRDKHSRERLVYGVIRRVTVMSVVVISIILRRHTLR